MIKKIVAATDRGPMFDLEMRRGMGIISVISTSKIKKITAIR